MAVHKCNCGREFCEYFDPSEGEWGESYTKKELEEKLIELKEKIKEIEEVLEK